MASTTLRNCPDVAIAATNIEIVRLGQPLSVNGTSASSPLWAGFTALVNEQAAANGLPPVGFLNPALYLIGQSAEYASSFHDISSGSNPSAQASFNSVPGYDLVTGWGTPKGLSLINALALRMPLHPPLSAAAIQYVRKYDCDSGPVAGAVATYMVGVSGGAAPFSYHWTADLPASILGSPDHPLATVIVPPTGQTVTLHVTVKDAAGNTLTTSRTDTARDPAQAARISAICQLLEKLREVRLKWPIYVNPGDPAPKSHPALSSAALQHLQDLAEDLKTNILKLRQISGE